MTIDYRLGVVGRVVVADQHFPVDPGGDSQLAHLCQCLVEQVGALYDGVRRALPTARVGGPMGVAQPKAKS